MEYLIGVNVGLFIVFMILKIKEPTWLDKFFNRIVIQAMYVHSQNKIREQQEKNYQYSMDMYNPPPY